MSYLGLTKEVEILDLDAVATAEEVRETILQCAKETGKLASLAEDTIRKTRNLAYQIG